MTKSSIGPTNLPQSVRDELDLLYAFAREHLSPDTRKYLIGIEVEAALARQIIQQQQDDAEPGDKAGVPLVAAIYCRLATSDQEHDRRMAEQEDTCRDYATERGYVVREGHIYRDIGSGNTLDRPGLDRLRQAIRERAIEVVLTTEPDRLSRDVSRLMTVLDECDRSRVMLEFATGVLTGRVRA